MASTVKSIGLSPPYFDLNFKKRVYSRRPIRLLGSRDPKRALSNNPVKVNVAVNGVSSSVKDFQKLEPLWDDGYGTETVKDYLDHAKDIVKPDGGPPRWFTPISCGPHLKGSPVLLFLPGIDGLGLGLMLHHKSLGKVFDVRCMHIPAQDRTPFEELVQWIEEALRVEHSSSPNKPIYLVGDSFGGCLALAVAARNPKIDLVLILANPATSLNLQLLLPVLEAFPDELHPTVSHLLSFVTGDLMKMARVDANTVGPPMQYFDQLASKLTALLPCCSGSTNILPKETLLWKLNLFQTAAAYANSRLHAVKAEVLVLASAQDNMLPCQGEASRLLHSLQNCKVKYFVDKGQGILLDNGINLLSVINGTSTYRRWKNHDFVMDFLPPSMSDSMDLATLFGLVNNYASPVFSSTMEDGKIVRGLTGVPNEGPVLLVGNHMLMGLDTAPLIDEFVREKKIMVRCLSHPVVFSENKELSPFRDFMVVCGALPVNANNLLKLLKAKSHVLLYPGGAREAAHRKGEAHKLFWPDQPEFVRIAAQFGAMIVPFGVVGEDDFLELVLDYDEQMKIPFLSDLLRSYNKKYESFNIRAGMSGEVANQQLHFPVVLPKIPGRLYYLFGKPIPTKGMKQMLKDDREKATQLYLQIQSDIETSMSYLLNKRKEDPYRSIISRTIYRTFHAPTDQVPTFEP